MSIEVVNITKTYKNFTALQNVNLHIPEGELVALLGPSGSGKTTLLRLIAGLEQSQQGRILFNGEDNTDRDVRERQVGFVFQHYALFRHMNIFDNIAFGLTVRPRKTRPSKREIHEKVHSLLRLVQLEGLAHRYPSQLSGGQRQRVALARALAVEPKFLLLDEPFGALDTKVRQELRRWLRHLHGKLGLTILFVTHDQEEAMELADRVVVMNEGRVEQVAPPKKFTTSPPIRLSTASSAASICSTGGFKTGGSSWGKRSSRRSTMSARGQPSATCVRMTWKCRCIRQNRPQRQPFRRKPSGLPCSGRSSVWN
ncbi:sulfate/thiosulfate ABC transporter ATP-binding protein [Brevibacillus agri BAB-2500]|nr:sulfate/thiosulfate ABC transporter ATP-binding protein [Brevibacillus agri BAB-2500]